MAGIREYSNNITHFDPILQLEPIGIPELVRNSTLSMPTLDWTPLKNLNPSRLHKIDDTDISFPSVINHPLFPPIAGSAAVLVVISMIVILSYVIVR